MVSGCIHVFTATLRRHPICFFGAGSQKKHKIEQNAVNKVKTDPSMSSNKRVKAELRQKHAASPGENAIVTWLYNFIPCNGWHTAAECTRDMLCNGFYRFL